MPAGLEHEPLTGGALSPRLRREFGRRLDHDFSEVRLHADGEAAEANRELGSHAFTRGRDIYFGRDRAQLRGREGRRLLAHELAHVAQSDRNPALATRIFRDGPSEELEDKTGDGDGNGAPKQGKADTSFFGNRTWRLDGTQWDSAYSLGFGFLNPALGWPAYSVTRDPNNLGAGPTFVPRGSHYDIQDGLKPTLGYLEGAHALTRSDNFYLSFLSLATQTNWPLMLEDPRFVSEFLPAHLPWAIPLLLGGQAAWSAWGVDTEHDPSKSDLPEAEWAQHLFLLKTLAQLSTSKWTTLEDNPVGPRLPIDNPAFVPKLGDFSLRPPEAGFDFTHQKLPTSAQATNNPNAVDGESGKFNATLNLARMFTSGEDFSGKAPFELGAWGTGDFRTKSTLLQLAQGLPPRKRWSLGLMGGDEGFLGGAQFGRVSSDSGLTMNQLDLGFGYFAPTPKPSEADKQRGSKAPTRLPSTPLTKLGVNFTMMDYDVGAGGLADRDADRLPSAAGQAYRLNPYVGMAFDASGHKFGFEVDLSLAVLANDVGVDALGASLWYELMLPSEDKLRLDLAYSRNRYEWFDPGSPLMQSIRGKVHVGPLFLGAQVDWMDNLPMDSPNSYAEELSGKPQTLRWFSPQLMLGYEIPVGK